MALVLGAAGCQWQWNRWRSTGEPNWDTAFTRRILMSSNLQSPKNSLNKKYKGSRKAGILALAGATSVTEEVASNDAEKKLIESLLGIQGRGRSVAPQQLKDVEQAINALESQVGISDPTSSPLIEGRWQLIFTTRPGTASPIQRTFVGVDAFTVFQEIKLRDTDPRVSNIVKFSDAIGELKVEAAALIENGKRILFRFDRAAFSFTFLPFKVPYPVPFRLLGDEAKGWLDTTYLSPTASIRISRGNKGTTFVLQKKIEPRQKLLLAISTGRGVQEVIEELILNHRNASVDLKLLEGKWRLLWSSQPKEGNWLEQAANGFQSLQIVRNNGQLEGLTQFVPSFWLRSRGNIMVASNQHYEVNIEYAALEFGLLKLPFKITSKMVLKLLYVDNKVRIMRAEEGWLFVHICEESFK